VSILQKIIEDKKTEVNEELKGFSTSSLTKSISDTRNPLDFKGKLSGKGLSIIAEIKKASPSKGLIRPDFDPVGFAKSYYQSGVDCISVLTERSYFQGKPEYLREIRETVSIPLLRKDFIVDKRQIRESYEMGADAILLIVSALTKIEIGEYKTLANEFGLSVLVEVHSREELDLALDLGCDLIGINNRNLTTFQTNIEHSIQLKPFIPETVITVSESGIRNPEDCLKLQEHGFHAVLVGETLMRCPDPGSAVNDLMKLTR
jgi:indole-3-glycerol phosphate synthase